MSLHKWDSDNGLQSIKNLYGIHKSTLSKLVKEFWRVVKKYLQPVFVKTIDESQFRILATRFKQLYGISYIIRAIEVRIFMF